MRIQPLRLSLTGQILRKFNSVIYKRVFCVPRSSSAAQFTVAVVAADTLGLFRGGRTRASQHAD